MAGRSSDVMTVRSLASSIGRGLVAGFAGTVAMTVFSTIEMKGARTRGELRARGCGGQGAGVMLPALDVAPPVTMWGGREVAIHAWHHLVYVVATGVAYEMLERADT